MNIVRVTDQTKRSQAIASALARVLHKAMADLRLNHREVSLVLVGDSTIARLNRKYRGIRKPTDVLSFGQDENGRKSPLLGDIVISIPTARRQAIQQKKSLRTEVALLAVHGLLHLMGHDHAEPKEARRMFRLQDRLLKKAIARV